MAEAENLDAVVTQLRVWGDANAIPVVVAGQPFESAPWYVRVSMLEGSASTVGTQKVRHPGILQVAIFGPIGEGPGAALRAARAAGQILNNSIMSGISFHELSVLPERIDENRIRIDAVIRYYWDEHVTPRFL